MQVRRGKWVDPTLILWRIRFGKGRVKRSIGNVVERKGGGVHSL